MQPTRRGCLKTLAAMAAAGTLAPARAQADWPVRPVKIIAPVAPGGGVDLVARTLAERLTKSFGQSFLVENLSGGGGVVASTTTARAAPDGYTLMVGYVGTHGTNPALRKLPYDALADFSPIAMVGGTPNVLVVHPSLPAKTLPEFIALLKSQPGRMNYGSAGPGTLTHLVMEQFKEATGTFLVHVPYRGIAPALTDLLANQTQASFPGLAAALPQIRAGKMRPIAITGLARHRLLPDVPTLEESGLKGFDGVQWYGIVGPAKLPAALVTRLNTEINNQLAMPDLRERLSGEALEPMPMAPDAFGKYIRDDIAKWARLAKARRIEID